MSEEVGIFPADTGIRTFVRGVAYVVAAIAIWVLAVGAWLAVFEWLMPDGCEGCKDDVFGVLDIANRLT